jgi:endonuclease/exonuclease/phosphatase family metal-dependent hydrolase
MTPRVHRLIATLTAFCLTGCAAIAVPAQPRVPASNGEPVFAVITWNLHGGRGDVARLVADLNSGAIATSRIVDYVLLVQEAVTLLPAAIDDTLTQAAALGLSTFFSPVRRDEARQSGNAMLSTRPLDDPRVIDLPRERQSRAAVMASIDVAGTRLFVVSAHLENRIGWTRGGLFSDGARGRQAEALIRALPAGAHGIVGGDMNTWLGPAEPAWRALLERFPDTPTERSQPTFRDRLVLDHLFFDLPDGWMASRQVIEEYYGSDHRPVLGLLYARRLAAPERQR